MPRTSLEHGVLLAKVMVNSTDQQGSFKDFGSIALYVVDAGNNRIEKFTTDGKFIKSWGISRIWRWSIQ